MTGTHSHNTWTRRLFVLLLWMMPTDPLHAFSPRRTTPYCHQSTTRFGSLSSSSSTSPSVASSFEPLQYIDGIRQLVDSYDVFVLDMWGVLHDGSQPYEGVLECLAQLKQHGKQLIILSNSSKRQSNSLKMLEKLGFDPSDFAQIITSGEVSYQLLLGKESSFLPKEKVWSRVLSKQEGNNNKVFVLGSGNQDEEYCTKSGWTLSPVEEADLLVARGTFTLNNGLDQVSKLENPELYDFILENSLKVAASRQLPMLVTNPDKVRPDEGLPPMPGALGDAYEQSWRESNQTTSYGDFIQRIGKPFSLVYDTILGDHVDKGRVCMVGDALETDITGGSGAGIATVWVVQDGIHGPDVRNCGSYKEGCEQVLVDFNAKPGTYAGNRILRPDHVVANFQW